MSRDELKKLVDEGHEIEFNYNVKNILLHTES